MLSEYITILKRYLNKQTIFEERGDKVGHVLMKFEF